MCFRRRLREIECVVAYKLIVDLHIFCFFSYIGDNVLQVIHVIHEFRVIDIYIDLECCIVIAVMLFLFILQIIPIELSKERVLIDFLNLAFLLIDAFNYFFCLFFVVIFWVILSKILIFLLLILFLLLLFFIHFLFLILLLLRLRVTVILQQLFLLLPKIIVVVAAAHNRLLYRLKNLYIPFSLLLIWLHIPLFRFLSFNHGCFLSRFLLLLLFTRSHRRSII